MAPTSVIVSTRPIVSVRRPPSITDSITGSLKARDANSQLPSLSMELDIDDIDAAGLDREKVDALVTRARREVDEGRLPSCQLAVARNGVIGAAATFGAPTTSRYVIFSATKAIVATAMWIVLDEGKVQLADTVAQHIPEFGANDKDAVTV